MRSKQLNYTQPHRLLTLVFLFCLFIVSANTALADTNRQIKTKKHFLWSVRSGTSTVYLLGSIHLLTKESYPLPAAIENIYDCCRKIVFETDLDSMASPELQKKMLGLARYPSGHSLKNNISTRTYGLLEKRLEGTELSIGQLNGFKPWFVALQVTSLELLRLGFNPELGIDRHFYEKAVRDRKKLLFLETNEYQINLFASINKKNQEILLRQMLKEIEIIKTEFAGMTEAWRTGDTGRLEMIQAESFKEYPSIYRRLITSRNRRWVSQMRKLLSRNGDALVIVGAGHLTGKEGLPALLKAKGYRVEQY